VLIATEGTLSDSSSAHIHLPARCITRTVELMAEAAARAGAPRQHRWMNTVTLEGTQELMKAARSP
jgi:hypothetical protein